MIKKIITGLVLTAALIVSGSLHVDAAEYIFEVPVNIAEVPDIGTMGGMLPGVNAFQVTCNVFDGGRQIGTAKKQQSISRSFRGNVEVRVNVPDTGAKADRYQCNLEICSSASIGSPRCMDPAGSVPAGSVVQVRDSIGR